MWESTQQVESFRPFHLRIRWKTWGEILIDYWFGLPHLSERGAYTKIGRDIMGMIVRKLMKMKTFET